MKQKNSQGETIAWTLVFLILILFWCGEFTTIDLDFWIWWVIIGFVVNFIYLAVKGHLSNPRTLPDLVIGSLLGIMAWPMTLIAIFIKTPDK